MIERTGVMPLPPAKATIGVSAACSTKSPAGGITSIVSPGARVSFIQFDIFPPGTRFTVTVKGSPVSGELDIAALESAFGDVIARHESLRTIFPDGERGPRQQILAAENSRPALLVTDTTTEALDEALASASRQGFDLAAEIPLRVHLFRLAPANHLKA